MPGRPADLPRGGRVGFGLGSVATGALLAAQVEGPALHMVAQPDSTLVALETDGSCDVFTVADELATAGSGPSKPQLTFTGLREALLMASLDRLFHPVLPRSEPG